MQQLLGGAVHAVVRAASDPVNATAATLDESLKGNIGTSGFVMATLALLVLLFDLFNACLRKRFTRSKRQHLLHVYHRITQEITILGLVSVLFFIEQQSGVFRSLGLRFGETFTAILFEFIHFSFFVGIIMYVVVMVAIMYIAVRLANHWRETQAEGRTKTRRAYEECLSQRSKMSRAQRLVSLRALWHFYTVRDKARFFLAKGRFTQQHQLDSHFDFARYLTKCIRLMLLELLEIHPSVWIVAVVVIAVATILVKYAPAPSVFAAQVAITVLGWAAFVASGLLYLKVRYTWNRVVLHLSVLRPPEELREEHLRLFWFRSPRFVFVCIQIIVLLNCMSLVGYLMFEIPSGDSTVFRAVNVSVCMFMTCFTFIPRMLPLYAMTVYTGGLSHQGLIDRIVANEEERDIRRALRRVASQVDILQLQQLLQDAEQEAAEASATTSVSVDDAQAAEGEYDTGAAGSAEDAEAKAGAVPRGPEGQQPLLVSPGTVEVLSGTVPAATPAVSLPKPHPLVESSRAGSVASLVALAGGRETGSARRRSASDLPALAAEPPRASVRTPGDGVARPKFFTSTVPRPSFAPRDSTAAGASTASPDGGPSSAAAAPGRQRTATLSRVTPLMVLNLEALRGPRRPGSVRGGGGRGGGAGGGERAGLTASKSMVVFPTVPDSPELESPVRTPSPSAPQPPPDDVPPPTVIIDTRPPPATAATAGLHERLFVPHTPQHSKLQPLRPILRHSNPSPSHSPSRSPSPGPGPGPGPGPAPGAGSAPGSLLRASPVPSAETGHALLHSRSRPVSLADTLHGLNVSEDTADGHVSEALPERPARHHHVGFSVDAVEPRFIILSTDGNSAAPVIEEVVLPEAVEAPLVPTGSDGAGEPDHGAAAAASAGTDVPSLSAAEAETAPLSDDRIMLLRPAPDGPEARVHDTGPVSVSAAAVGRPGSLRTPLDAVRRSPSPASMSDGTAPASPSRARTTTLEALVSRLRTPSHPMRPVSRPEPMPPVQLKPAAAAAPPSATAGAQVSPPVPPAPRHAHFSNAQPLVFVSLDRNARPRSVTVQGGGMRRSFSVADLQLPSFGAAAAAAASPSPEDVHDRGASAGTQFGPPEGRDAATAATAAAAGGPGGGAGSGAAGADRDSQHLSLPPGPFERDLSDNTESDMTQSDTDSEFSGGPDGDEDDDEEEVGGGAGGRGAGTNVDDEGDGDGMRRDPSDRV